MKARFTILISFLIFLTFQLSAQNVLTHAGVPGTPDNTDTGTYRLNAYLNGPYGLAFDSKGNLWFTNNAAHTVGMIYQNYSLLFIRAGGYMKSCFYNAGGTVARFSFPAGIAIDANDNIYVADQGNHCIRKIAPFTALHNTQAVSILAGKTDFIGSCYKSFQGYKDTIATEAKFSYPIDVTVDPTGNVYVADQGNHCIRKIDVSGNVTTYAGQAGTNSSVDGNRLTKATFNYPSGIYYYNGKIYVSERGSSLIRVIDGNNVTTLNNPYPSLWTPDGIYIHTTGDVYVADQHKIQLYNFKKTTTFAGCDTLNVFGFKNDTGTAARFYDVKDVIADPKNGKYFYVADNGNHLIRRVVICDQVKPTIATSGNTTTCLGDTVTLTAPSGFVKYIWSTGEKTRQIKVTDQGTSNITCTVYNEDLCPGVSDPIVVKINKLTPAIQFAGPKTFCTGGSVLMSGQPGMDYYKWMKDGNIVKEGVEGIASSFTATTAGTYSLIGTSGPCTGESTKYVIDVATSITPEVVVYSGDTNLCDGEAVTIRTKESYFKTFDWKKNGTSTGITTRNIDITAAGNYTVDVFEEKTNCSGTSIPMKVTKLPAPPKPTITIEADTTLTSSSATGNQWYLYGDAIPGATGQQYKPDTIGMYKVEVTNAEGCKKSSDFVEVGEVSIQEHNLAKNISIYPNPNNGQFTIEAEVLVSDDMLLKVMDVMGKTVYEENLINPSYKFSHELDLSGLNKGIYIINLSSGNKMVVRKIAIE